MNIDLSSLKPFRHSLVNEMRLLISRQIHRIAQTPSWKRFSRYNHQQWSFFLPPSRRTYSDYSRRGNNLIQFQHSLPFYSHFLHQHRHIDKETMLFGKRTSEIFLSAMLHGSSILSVAWSLFCFACSWSGEEPAPSKVAFGTSFLNRPTFPTDIAHDCFGNSQTPLRGVPNV